MLISGKELLTTASEHNFAVPAFNVSDYSMVRAVLEAAEEQGSPVLIAIHPIEIANLGWDVMPSIIQMARKASVPVAIHWDHGADFEEILRAIQGGFTSVMIDGSMLPFEDNIALTKKVVDAAHAVGVSVEGELGTIGKTDSYAEGGADEIAYTVPADAVAFVERTGVDSLAVAIGTRHGIYPSDLQPELKLDLLKEIDEVVAVPLVLHGGSNNPDSEIASAAASGVNKINISSDIKVAYYAEKREVLKDPQVRESYTIDSRAREALKKVANQKISLFQAADKARLY